MNLIDAAWPSLVVEPIELRSREYKRSAPWNDLRHHIAKTALAMANLRDGGYIVIGVATESNSLLPIGMEVEHVKTYDLDTVMEFPQRYARPRVEMHCEVRVHDDRQYVVICVEQFVDVPIVCGKAHDSSEDDPRLKKDTIYVRPPGKPQSKAADADDLRELLDLATDVKLRSFVQRVARHGSQLQPLLKSDEDQYHRERIEFDRSDGLSTLASGAHHEWMIRPTTYRAERLPEATELLRVAEDVSVRVNGWSLPRVLPGRDDLIEIGAGFTGGKYGDPAERECWRLYRSGHLLDYFTFYEDSYESETREWNKHRIGDRKLPGFVSIKRLIAHCWGAVQLAGRLCKACDADSMILDLALVGIGGRALTFSSRRRNLDRFYVATTNRLGKRWELDANSLQGTPGDAADAIAGWFLKHFQCEYQPDVIASLRGEIARGDWS